MHIYDGMPHPVTGNPNWKATTFTRNNNVINMVRFEDGKHVLIARPVIDPGKTITGSTEVSSTIRHFTSLQCTTGDER